MRGRNGFIPLMGQDEIDRLNALAEERRRRRERRGALRAIGWSLILAGQIVLLVVVAAQHEAWPW